MHKNMIDLMASIGCQLNVPNLAPAKGRIVKAACAGVLALGVGMTGAAHAQEQTQSHTGEVAIGAAVGGVGGWAVGKIFGAAPAARNIMGAIGAAAGGVIAHGAAKMEEAAKAAPALPAAAHGLQPLEATQVEGMNRLQLTALTKRLNYQTAFKQAQEAKLNVQLNAGNPEFESKMKAAASQMMQMLRLDAEASKNFIAAVEMAKTARYDVSAYAATYSKLKQKFDVNDQSYSKLADQVLKNAEITSGVKADAKTEAKAESKSSGLSI